MNALVTVPDAAARPGLSRAEAIGFGAFTVFTLVALAGYGLFGLHPELLANLPAGVRRFYPIAFGFFGRIQIAAAAAVLCIVLVRRSGWRWLPAFGLAYVIGLSSELLGTGYGIPFGPYSYTPLLGGRWFDLVPYLIPLSWFLMAIPSYGLARAVVGADRPLARVLVAAAILTVWDLSLDPAMSHLTRYWVWAEAGPYYGMPLVNLVGWLATGLAIMMGFHALRVSRWLDVIPARLLGGFYAVNLLMPLGMNALAGLAGAVVAGVAPFGLLAALARWNADMGDRGLRFATGVRRGTGNLEGAP